MPATHSVRPWCVDVSRVLLNFLLLLLMQLLLSCCKCSDSCCSRWRKFCWSSYRVKGGLVQLRCLLCQDVDPRWLEIFFYRWGSRVVVTGSASPIPPRRRVNLAGSGLKFHRQQFSITRVGNRPRSTPAALLHVGIIAHPRI